MVRRGVLNAKPGFRPDLKFACLESMTCGWRTGICPVLLLARLPALAFPPARPSDRVRDSRRGSIFRASGHAPAGARFHFIALDEPPKDAVLRHATVPRRAFAVIYDRATIGRRGRRGPASGQARVVEGSARGAASGRGAGFGDRGPHRSRRPSWRDALRARNVRDPNEVLHRRVAGRHVRTARRGGPADRARDAVLRLARGRTTTRTRSKVSRCLSNLTDGQGAGLCRYRIGSAPVTRDDEDFSGGPVGPLVRLRRRFRSRCRRGRGGKIEDGEVRWEKWRFRYGLHPREGWCCIPSGMRMAGGCADHVPRRAIGDGGARTATPVARGSSGIRSTPGNSDWESWRARCVRVWIVRRTARCSTPRWRGNRASRDKSRGAIGLYERETGIAWKHGDNTRRARDLVLFYSARRAITSTASSGSFTRTARWR